MLCLPLTNVELQLHNHRRNTIPAQAMSKHNNLNQNRKNIKTTISNKNLTRQQTNLSCPGSTKFRYHCWIVANATIFQLARLARMKQLRDQKPRKVKEFLVWIARGRKALRPITLLRSIFKSLPSISPHQTSQISDVCDIQFTSSLTHITFFIHHQGLRTP